MSKPNYQCRRCEKLIEANPNVYTKRVVCYWCGGTCDPTPREQSRINHVRQLAKEQRLKEIRYSCGYGNNSEVNRHNKIVGVTPKDLE